MTRPRLTDILLNSFLPVIAGAVFYLSVIITGYRLPGAAYIPDGLWAYGFCSSLLIVWNRRLPLLWLLFAGLCAIAFEILQSQHYISGTGDPADMVVYFSGGSLAILTNPFFRTRFHHLYKHSTTKPLT